MIRPPKSFYSQIVEAAKSGRPEEICGLLGGIVSGDEKTAKEIYFLENIDHSNEHFSMNPKEQLEAIKDMRSKGLIPLGNFHSHPESPSRSSEEDKRLAYDRTASYRRSAAGLFCYKKFLKKVFKNPLTNRKNMIYLNHSNPIGKINKRKAVGYENKISE